MYFGTPHIVEYKVVNLCFDTVGLSTSIHQQTSGSGRMYLMLFILLPAFALADLGFHNIHVYERDLSTNLDEKHCPLKTYFCAWFDKPEIIQKKGNKFLKLCHRSEIRLDSSDTWDCYLTDFDENLNGFLGSNDSGCKINTDYACTLGEIEKVASFSVNVYNYRLRCNTDKECEAHGIEEFEIYSIEQAHGCSSKNYKCTFIEKENAEEFEQIRELCEPTFPDEDDYWNCYLSETNLDILGYLNSSCENIKLESFCDEDPETVVIYDNKTRKIFNSLECVDPYYDSTDLEVAERWTCEADFTPICPRSYTCKAGNMKEEIKEFCFNTGDKYLCFMSDFNGTVTEEYLVESCQSSDDYCYQTDVDYLSASESESSDVLYSKEFSKDCPADKIC